MSDQGEHLTPPQNFPTLRDLLDKNGQKITDILADIGNNGLSERERALYGRGHPVMELAEAASFIMNDRESDRDGTESYLVGFISAARVLGAIGVWTIIEDLHPVDLIRVPAWDWGERHTEIARVVGDYSAESMSYTYRPSSVFHELVAAEAPRPMLAQLGWYTCLAMVETAQTCDATDESIAITGVSVVEAGRELVGEIQKFLAEQSGEKS